MALRRIAALALAVGLVTCSDAGTGPTSRDTGRAQFAFAPRFTARAAAAATNGEATFDNVRIVITRPPSTILLDTAVTFAPGDPELNLRLAVDARNDEQLVADIQYREDSAIVYEGSVDVTARVGGDATSGGGSPTPVTVDYVGPGATATRVVLSLDSADVSAAEPLQLSATATDDSGKVFTNTPFGWTTSDSSIATVSSTGLVTATGKRGSVTVTAVTPTGISGSALLHCFPRPARMFVVSGTAQENVIDAALAQAFVIEVDGVDSLPIEGQLVSFSATDGTVDVDTASTGADGRAQTHMALGDTTGTAVFLARAGTLSASLSATVDAATLAKVSGDGQTAVAGETLAETPTVSVSEPLGNAAAGVPVVFTVASGGGHVGDTAAVRTDASGHASSGGWTLGRSVGAQTLTATVPGGPSVTFTATATIPPAASKLGVVASAPTTATSGAALTPSLAIQLEDSSGAAVIAGGVSVTASVSSGFQLRGATASTDAETGIATFGNLRIVGSGTAQVTFSATGMQPVVQTITVSAAPGATLTLVGDSAFTLDFNLNTTSGSSVRVTDSTGTPVPHYWLHFTVASAGTTVFTDSAQTGTDGTVTVSSSKVQFATPGVYDVEIVGSGLLGSPLHVKVTVASPTLSLVSTAPSTWTDGSFANPILSVKLLHADGTPLSGGPIVARAVRLTGDSALALSDDSVAVTGADGTASFAVLRVVGKLGTFRLTFTYPNSSTTISTGAITLSVGSISQVVAHAGVTRVQSVGPSSVSASNLPSLAITDVGGNPITGVRPVWSKSSPCFGTLTFGTTPASDTSGIAASPSIAIPAGVTGSCGIRAIVTTSSLPDTVNFSLVVAPVGAVVYTGNSGTDATKWSDPANWSGNAVPGAADLVVIDSSVTDRQALALDIDGAIGSLDMERKADLELGTHNLSVAGDLRAATDTGGVDSLAAVVNGTGTVTLTGGSGSVVSVVMAQASLVVGTPACGGTSYTSGYVHALRVTVNCSLSVGGLIRSRRSFETQGSGTITMSSSAVTPIIVVFDTLANQTTFNGGDETGLLVNGIIEISGDFRQSGNPRSFAQSRGGNFYFLIGKQRTRHVQFDTPGNDSSKFGDVQFLGSTSIPMDTTVAESDIFADRVVVEDVMNVPANRMITINTRLDVTGTGIFNGPGFANGVPECFLDAGGVVNITYPSGAPLPCAVSSSAARRRSLPPPLRGRAP